MKDLIRQGLITTPIITSPVGPMIGGDGSGGGGDPLAAVDIIFNASGAVELKGNTLNLPDQNQVNSSFPSAPSYNISTDVPNGNYTHSSRIAGQDAEGVMELIMNDPTELDMGTGDYTVEFWIKREETITGTFVRWLNAYGAGTEHYLRFQTWSSSSATLRLSHNSWTGQSIGAFGVWRHVALVRSGGVVKQYDNGNNDSTASAASAWDLHDGGSMAIGYRPQSSNVDDSGPRLQLAMLRIYKGYAKYTGNFTPE